MKCPNSRGCNNTEKFKILFENQDPELPSAHVRCEVCGFQFNQWKNVSKEILIKIFGDNWKHYK